MSKYIDGDKLRSIIKVQIKGRKEWMKDIDRSDRQDQLWSDLNEEDMSILQIINSLQQEQLPGIEEHGVPGKDFIPVEWVDACEKYGKWKIVQQEQPSLPPNIDEAAHDYAWEKQDMVYDAEGEGLMDYGPRYEAFKAGAEWMAKQGLISEGIIYQTSGEDTTIELNEHIGYLEDCDEVIVNIRKKEENHD